jgi:hypothetical protein
MNHPAFQSRLLGTAHGKRLAFNDDVKRSAGTMDDPRRGRPDLISILTLPGILWAGLLVLACGTSHYLLHLT